METNSVVTLHLMIDAASGRMLYQDGDALHLPCAFPEIDFDSTVVFALEFVNRERMPDLSWRLSPHALAPGVDYSLSGGCVRSTEPTPMFCSLPDNVNLPGNWPDGSDPDPVRGRLTFRIQTGDLQFFTIASHKELSRFCHMTVSARQEGAAAVLARIPFRPRNRSGEQPGLTVGGGGGMTLNDLSGSVVLADSAGNRLPVSGQTITVPATGDGLFPNRDPAAELPVWDAEFGICHYLDATFPRVSFAWPVHRLRKITTLIRSANPAITGNIVLTPLVDGEARPSVSIAVDANWTEATIPLTVETGEVALRRDAGGTLSDGGMVTAILRCVTLWEAV